MSSSNYWQLLWGSYGGSCPYAPFEMGGTCIEPKVPKTSNEMLYFAKGMLSVGSNRSTRTQSLPFYKIGMAKVFFTYYLNKNKQQK